MTHPSERAAAIVAAARACVGTRFRPQGRDAEFGLDCVGLVLVSLGRVGVRLPLPADYQPRRRELAVPHEALLAAGLVEVRGGRRCGDILLLKAAPTQAHLAIAASSTEVVHAHAGIGRVVRSALPTHWPAVAAWRLGPAPDGEPRWLR